MGRQLSPEQAAAAAMWPRPEAGLSLPNPDGLLKSFTKKALETALGEQMTEHLGRVKKWSVKVQDGVLLAPQVEQAGWIPPESAIWWSGGLGDRGVTGR